MNKAQIHPAKPRRGRRFPGGRRTCAAMIVAAVQGAAGLSWAAPASDPPIVQAFHAGNEAMFADTPAYIVRLYAERFFLALAEACPDAGVGRAPGHPGATMYVATPTLIPNPGQSLVVQALKTAELAHYLSATQASDDARQFAASSRCDRAAVRRVTRDMARHLTDPDLMGPVAPAMAAQCETRPNLWDGRPCDCLASKLDMAATPRTRRMLVDDFWGWKEALIDGDSRLYNQTMVSCTRSAPIAHRTPDRESLGTAMQLLSESYEGVSGALSVMIQFEGITLPDAVARPMYEHAFPIWGDHGDRSRLLVCYYGRNNQSADRFTVMFWKNTVLLSRSDFAALSTRHPLMLVVEAVRTTCPGVDEAVAIREASHLAARALGYH